MNYNDCLVSVIVPVYNVLSFLERCVFSIMEQDYSNLEILLIDDGSTDGSGELCNKMAEYDHRIRVIHKSNGGLSSARNAGIAQAKGTYISFVDSDDYISKTMISSLLNPIIGKNNVISCCGINYVSEKNEIIKSYKHEASSQNVEDYLKSLLLHRGDCAVWSKLFHKDIFHDCVFADGRLNEDVLFMFHALTHIDKIVFVEECGYYYYTRPDSISRCFGKAVHDMVVNAHEIFLLAQKNYPKLSEVANRFEIYQNISFMRHFPAKMKPKDDPFYGQSLTFLRSNLKKGIHNRYLSVKDKMQLIIMCISPRIIIWCLYFKHNFTERK